MSTVPIAPAPMPAYLESIATFLKSVGSQLLVPTLTVAGIAALIGWYVKARVDAYFSREGERFRDQLGYERRIFEDNLQRRMQEFSLYTTKKYEVYAEMHRRLQIAYSMAWKANGDPGDLSDVHKLDEEHVEALLRRAKCNETHLTLLLERWTMPLSPQAKESLVRHALDTSWRERADDAMYSAIDYVNEHTLYLSDPVTALAGKCANQLLQMRDGRDLGEQDVSLLKQLRGAMQNELSGGMVAAKPDVDQAGADRQPGSRGARPSGMHARRLDPAWRGGRNPAT